VKLAWCCCGGLVDVDGLTELAQGHSHCTRSRWNEMHLEFELICEREQSLSPLALGREGSVSRQADRGALVQYLCELALLLMLGITLPL